MPHVLTRCVLVLAGAVATVSAAAGAPATSVEPSPQRIRAHVEFLADDLLEGRAAGSRGFDLAARYVATQFELLGLKPAGTNGSWY